MTEGGNYFSRGAIAFGDPVPELRRFAGIPGVGNKYVAEVQFREVLLAAPGVASTTRAMLTC